MNIVIVGGGICGLGAALLLARDGHQVTVLERDTEPLPGSALAAWDVWERKGVAQFRQPHNFMPGLRVVLEAELPDLPHALLAAGACRFDMVNPLPPTFTDRTPRPIDEKLWTLTARRPVGEWVFADAVQREPRVTVRRGAAVASLLADAPAANGIPHVGGVVTAEGERLSADLVVDATGRQSRTDEWMRALGGRAPYQEQEDCGFTYYTRYFTGTMPSRRAATLTPVGSMSLLTLPGDNDTWSVTVFVATGDQALKHLRHEDRWSAVVRACPLHAHWLDGTPITPVLAMAGIADRYRRLVVDGTPIVTGLVPLADAAICTNPSAGRGLTVGFLHAVLLRDVLRTHGAAPRALVEEFDRQTEAKIAPWYHAQIALDRTRFAEMEAIRDGRPSPPPANPLARRMLALLRAMTGDPELFRATLEYFGTITPIQNILDRPGIAQRVDDVLVSMERPGPPPMGPTRDQLLQIVA